MVGAFKLHMIGISKEMLLFFFLDFSQKRERERDNTLQFVCMSIGSALYKV